jgi:hypothetical protein
VYRCGPPLLTLSPEVLRENPVDGFFPFRPCRDGKKSRRFIHHQNVPVFIEEKEAAGKAALWYISFSQWVLTPPVIVSYHKDQVLF